MVLLKTYQAIPFCDREICRYAGTNGENAAAILEECKAEAEPCLSYKVCYLPLSLHVTGDECDFGAFSVHSRGLAHNLAGCREVVLFAATVGVGIDRLIARYGVQSPAKALLLDAIGSERIESLCDRFCADLAREKNLRAMPRFSPGYGDLDLSFQKTVFSLLNCQKQIGLTVTDSLLMSPSKSVTAFAGFGESVRTKGGCASCTGTDCAFHEKEETDNA